MKVSLKTIKFFLDALHYPIMILDLRFRPVITNPSFTRMFEITPDAVKGDFVARADCEPSLQTILAPIVASGCEVDGAETICTLPSGQRIILLVNAQRINTLDLPEMILVELKDISKEREAELRIQELNAAHQVYVTKIEALNKELESYSHSVAHNLRTPLRFVNRIVYLLLHETDANLSENAIKQLNLILKTTVEMGKLIESLMLFSQANQIPLKMHRIDLTALFEEVAKELQQEQAGRNVEIIFQNLPPCQGDRVLLKEVVRNLLENAIKFTYMQKDPRITVGCTESTSEKVYFIQDNGVGFDQSKKDDLFIPFLRLQNAADFEGLGIGLALVQRIIERHGGQVWAESEINKGAIFYFTLVKVTPG